MICKNCSTEIAGEALICYRCGTATSEPARQLVEPGQDRAPPARVPAPRVGLHPRRRVLYDSDEGRRSTAGPRLGDAWCGRSAACMAPVALAVTGRVASTKGRRWIEILRFAFVNHHVVSLSLTDIHLPRPRDLLL